MIKKTSSSAGADSIPSAQLSPKAPSMQALLDLTRDDIKRVNGYITDNMQSDIPLIPLLAGHLINAGGKRVRPLLMIATAHACQENADESSPLDADMVASFACCIEFIHTATLLHDDVIDESDLRRGKDTAHTIWGNQATVLVGDFLFSRAFQIMAFSNNVLATQQLASASVLLAEGEILQLQTAGDKNTTVETYLKMIRSKTAVLFSSACKIGGLLSGAPDSTCEALYTYGENIGIAFQLMDDKMDYSVSADEMGKNTGDDFKEGKITLPTLLLFAQATREEKDFLERTLVQKTQDTGDYDTLCALIEKYDTLAQTHTLAQKHITHAKQALAVLAPSPYKTALEEVADYIIQRQA